MNNCADARRALTRKTAGYRLIEEHLKYLRTVRRLSPRTITARRDLLRRVHRDLPYGIDQATTEELADWLARPREHTRVERGRTEQSVATYGDGIRGFFAWACNPDHPLLDYNPAAALPRPHVPQTLPKPTSTAELDVALARLPEPWRTYVLLAAFAGLRCCEIATITREEITKDWIIVKGKGGRIGAVPTHPLVWASVRALPPGPIAHPVNGEPATAHYISRQARHQFAQIGLVGVTMHRWRHWLGTESLRARDPETGHPIGNLRRTQELLRHSSPGTTAIYTKVTDEERRAVIHALPVPAAAS